MNGFERVYNHYMSFQQNFLAELVVLLSNG